MEDTDNNHTTNGGEDLVTDIQKIRNKTAAHAVAIVRRAAVWVTADGVISRISISA
jgi:hypothetical protein